MRTLDQKKEIVDYYNLGNSLKKTSQKFQVSSTGIITYLKLFGYKTRSIRDGMKKQKIDESFFEKIDNSKLCTLFSMYSTFWFNKSLPLLNSVLMIKAIVFTSIKSFSILLKSVCNCLIK